MNDRHWVGGSPSLAVWRPGAWVAVQAVLGSRMPSSPSTLQLATFSQGNIMDFSGFIERFRHYVNVTDPRTLVYSDEQVLEAKAAVDKGQQGEGYEFNKNLVNAAIHPVTGEVIPKLFRVSAIAPVNIPLIWAMIACPASNVPGTLFLHWLNQSYNTACNYANRSGSDQPISQIMKAYGLAVGSACTLAYGLGKVVARSPALQASGALIPCIATAAANCSNIGFTRMNEITEGTSVFDEDGKVRVNMTFPWLFQHFFNTQ